MSQVKQAIDFSPILQPIQRNPAFSYFGVVLSLDGEVHVLKKAPALPGHAEYVVVEVSTDKYHPEVSVGKEAGLAAINCGSMIVLVGAVIGGAGAAPISGGSSSIVSVAAASGTVATFLSCANSAARTYIAINSPEDLTYYDNNPAYKLTLQMIDGVALFGIGAVAWMGSRAGRILAKAGVGLQPAVQGTLDRASRKWLTKEIHKSVYPGMSNKKLKALIRAGKAEKIYSAKQISEGAIKELLNSLSASLSLFASGLDGNVREIVVNLVAIDD